MTNEEHRKEAERLLDSFKHVADAMKRQVEPGLPLGDAYAALESLAEVTLRAAQVHATLASTPEKRTTPVGYM